MLEKSKRDGFRLAVAFTTAAGWFQSVKQYGDEHRKTGRVLITPECSSLDEVEGQINALQDELDELRERARRAFSPLQGPGAIL